MKRKARTACSLPFLLVEEPLDSANATKCLNNVENRGTDRAVPGASSSNESPNQAHERQILVGMFARKGPFVPETPLAPC